MNSEVEMRRSIRRFKRSMQTSYFWSFYFFGFFFGFILAVVICLFYSRNHSNHSHFSSFDVALVKTCENSVQN